MDDTPNLKLPYIMPAQAQKHVTHNEALRALDCIVQLSVIDRDLSAPPSSPANGARYIVAGSPSGAWSGHTNHVAVWQDGAWVFYTPAEGWVAWVRDEDSLLVWNGSGWAVAGGGGGGGVNPVAMVGVNATADTTNRLSVKSNAVLFSHDDVTPGTGDQRTIVNKAAAGKTASHLFQTGFSGRAEFGLTGDDDFHVKVSPNGSTWFEAMVVDRSTGKVRFPTSGSREVLTANRTYYVRTDGSDSNDGLTNTAGGAFASLQKAIDTALKLDFNGCTVTIQLADGAYTAGGVIGSGVGITAISRFVIQGNAASPGNVIVSAPSGSVISAVSGGIVTLKDMELRDGGAGVNCVSAEEGGCVEFSNLRFGTTSSIHLYASGGGRIIAIGDYSIVGSAAYHAYVVKQGLIRTRSTAVTLIGAPNFSYFAVSSMNCLFDAPYMTFSGGATGGRYIADLGGGIYVGGGGANYFPGDVAGSITSPGWYV